MEKKLGRIPVTTLTVAMAVVVYILRHVQLQTQLDEAGKIVAGAGKGPLTWICLICAVLAAVYSFLLKKKDTPVGKSPVSTVLTLAAAFLMAMGGASTLQQNMILGMGSLVSAVCWVIIALQRQQDTEPSAVLFMVPALFYAVELIVRFRDWSRDPLILDYCFELFASLSVMCATYHLGGFSLGVGKRRLTVFYCLCGVIFSATAMAGVGVVSHLATGGAALWLLSNLWLLLSEE